MNRQSRLISSRFVQLMLIVGLMFMFAYAGTITVYADGHQHCACAGLDGSESTHDDTQAWTEWKSTTELPDTAGYYYLADDVTLSECWSAPDNIHLCLNGHAIIGNIKDAASNDHSAIIQASWKHVYICDCNGSNSTHYFTVDANGLYHLDTDGDTSGDKEIYGGVITGADNALDGWDSGGNRNYTVPGTSIVVGQYCEPNNTGRADVGSGGAIYAHSGNITMYGGSIVGNTAFCGGAVGGYSNTVAFTGVDVIGNTTKGGGAGIHLWYGTVTLKDCNFTYNVAAGNGAAVNYRAALDLTVINSEIKHNKANNYGGLCVSSLTMKNSEIESNSATGTASDLVGGIYVSGTSTIDSSAIMDNSGLGARLGDTTLRSSDPTRSTTIEDNKVGDLYLNSGKLITIDADDPISDASRIKVTTQQKPTMDNPVQITADASVDNSTYFLSQDSGYKVYNKGEGSSQHAVLSVHEHTWTYEEAGDTLNAYCTEDFGTDYCKYTGVENEVSVKIIANDAVYNGKAYKKSEQVTLEGADKFKKVTGTDFSMDDVTLDGSVKDPIVNAGTWVAGLVVSTPSGDKSISTSFTIAPADCNLQVDSLFEATFGDEAFNLNAKSDDSNIKYSLKSGDAVTVDDSGNVTPVKAGKAIITVTSGGVNYKAESRDVTVIVSKAKAGITVNNSYAKTYGDDNFTLGATADTDADIQYSVKGDAVSVDENGVVTLKQAGTATIIVYTEETDNYLAGIEKITVTVEKKQGTLVISEVEYNVTYGDHDFTIGEITSEGDAEDPVTFESDKTDVATVDADGKVSITGAGTAIITVSRQGGTNYLAPEPVKVTVNVAKADPNLLVAETYKNTYGDAAFNLGATTISTAAIEYAVTEGKDVVSVDADGRVSIIGAGTATITLSVPEAANYKSAEATTTVTVDPKQIQVVADDQTTYVGCDLDELTYEQTGLVDGDSFSGKLETDANMNQAGSYEITQGTLTAGDNYVIEYTAGTYTVKALENKFFVKGSAKKTSVKYTWTKVEGANKYKVYQCICGTTKAYMWKCIKTTTGTSVNKTGLKARQSYKAYVVAYDSNGNMIAQTPTIHVALTGKKQLANVTGITAKKSISLAIGQSTNVKAKITKKSNKNKLLSKTHEIAKIRYYSGNRSIATVSSNGTVSGLKKGSVYIYAVAPDGLRAVTKVIVQDPVEAPQ